MFASIKQSLSHLFSGSEKQDAFSMEQRTRALLIQTQRNRKAGKQIQQRAHRPMAAAATPQPRVNTVAKPDIANQKSGKTPALKSRSNISLTNLNSDVF
ncbi:MAG: hypothetical protein ACC707_09035 [Thiohalomonadales bacterium]